MIVLLIVLFLYPIWGWAALGAWGYAISTRGSMSIRLILAAIAASTGTALFTPAVWGPPEGFAFFVPWGMALLDKAHMNFFSWKAPACTFFLGFSISLLSSAYGKRHRPK
jgi:hypothetical protein